jgi:hypothetical protein
MQLNNVERGDTVRIESNEYKYDGHEGIIFQLYEKYAIVQLKNADGVVLAAPWDYLTPVGG